MGLRGYSLSSTIYEPFKQIRIMKQKIFYAVFVIVCVALVVVSVDSVNCHRANVSLRKTVISQANEISEMMSAQGESDKMYVGLGK